MAGPESPPDTNMFPVSGINIAAEQKVSVPNVLGRVSCEFVLSP